jgi:O-methyltransferase
MKLSSIAPKALTAARRAATLIPGIVEQPAEQLGPDFERALARAQPFTMTSRERMYGLWQAAQYVSRAGIAGDFVECGVWRGGSSMLAALAFAGEHDARQMWLYDTFEGMTPPTERDRLASGQTAAERLAQQNRETGLDWAYASLGDVKANMASITEQPGDRVCFVQGPVEETIPGEAPAQIALLRLDTDWYESTKHELEHLWPRLTPGGVLIIDDYGHWQGAREAVDEYLTANGIHLLLTRVDYTGRLAIKPA